MAAGLRRRQRLHGPVAGNHGHSLSIPKADLDSAVDKAYSLVPSVDGHTHVVTFTVAELRAPKAGSSLTVLFSVAIASSLYGGNHSHDVTAAVSIATCSWALRQRGPHARPAIQGRGTETGMQHSGHPRKRAHRCATRGNKTWRDGIAAHSRPPAWHGCRPAGMLAGEAVTLRPDSARTTACLLSGLPASNCTSGARDPARPRRPRQRST